MRSIRNAGTMIESVDDRKPSAKLTPVDVDAEPRTTGCSVVAVPAAAGDGIPRFCHLYESLLSFAVNDRQPLLSSDDAELTYRDVLDKRRPSRADQKRAPAVPALVIAIDTAAYEIARTAEAMVMATEGMKRKAEHNAELERRAAKEREGWTRLPSGWLEEDTLARIELLVARERERAVRASCRPFWGVGGGQQWLSFNEQLALMYPPIWTLAISRAGAVTANGLEQVLRV